MGRGFNLLTGIPFGGSDGVQNVSIEGFIQKCRTSDLPSLGFSESITGPTSDIKII